ncbi:hypothetical protein CR513_02464, partial [Mucuna pruriens]
MVVNISSSIFPPISSSNNPPSNPPSNHDIVVQQPLSSNSNLNGGLPNLSSPRLFIVGDSIPTNEQLKPQYLMEMMMLLLSKVSASFGIQALSKKSPHIITYALSSSQLKKSTYLAGQSVDHPVKTVHPPFAFAHVMQYFIFTKPAAQTVFPSLQ